MKFVYNALLLFLPFHIWGQKVSPKQQPLSHEAKIGLTPKVSPKQDSLDKETGLVNDKNLSLIKAHCTACHSSKLILQHNFTREGWKDKIRWMQKKHNLWDLGDSEKIVLDYLERYYSKNDHIYLSLRRQRELKEFIWYKL